MSCITKASTSKGHSWDETLAERPSWLDHLLSWMIVVILLAITLFLFIVLQQAFYLYV